MVDWLIGAGSSLRYEMVVSRGSSLVSRIAYCVRKQTTEDRSQRVDDGRQKTDESFPEGSSLRYEMVVSRGSSLVSRIAYCVRKQTTEDRSQRVDDGRQKTDESFPEGSSLRYYLLSRFRTEAREYWEKALELYKKIGMPHMVEKVEGWMKEE